jgi:hypothetical protein
MRTSDDIPVARQLLAPAVSEVEALSHGLRQMLDRQPADQVLLLLQDPVADLEQFTLQARALAAQGPTAGLLVPLDLDFACTLVPDLGVHFEELADEARSSRQTSVRELEAGGFRLLLAHCPAAKRSARRRRAAQVRRALALAFALIDRLEAQDQGRSTALASLTDAQACRRLHHALQRLGLDRLLRADLEQGDIFTWRWQLDPLLTELSRDGALALLTNSRDLEPDRLVDAFLARAAHQSRYAAAPSYRFPSSPCPEPRLEPVTDLSFLADGLLSVMARNAALPNRDDHLHALLRDISTVHVATLDLGSGQLGHGITGLTDVALRAFDKLGVPKPHVDRLVIP